MGKKAEELKVKKAKEKFSRWYERNSDEYNAQRRERYSQDPEARAKAIENAKRQREVRRKAGPISTDPIRRDGQYVYRTAQVAVMLDKSTETIRGWRRNGWLPEADKRVLYYTKPQITLMKKLAKVIDECRYDKDYEQKLDEVVEYIEQRW